MKHQTKKTKEQLIADLEESRSHIAYLEQSKNKKTNTDEIYSESLFSTIFNNAADGIIIADAETQQIHMANKTISEATGYDQKTFQKLKIPDLHPKDELPYVLKEFNKQVKGDFPLCIDIPVKRKDGSIFYADVNSIPIMIHGKKHLMGIFRDVTDRRKTYQALKESESKYRAIFESTNEAILYVDKFGNIIDVNCRADDIFGYTKEDLVGRHFLKACAKALSPKTLMKAMELFKKAVTKAKSESPLEWELKHKKGHIVIIEINTSVIKKEGKTEGFVVILRDITERKKAEQNLRQSEEKYRTLAASIPGMVYSANPDWSVDFISNSEEVSGYIPKQFYEKKINWLDIIHPDDRKAAFDKGSQLTHHKQNIIDRYRIITKTGDIRWVEDHKTSFFNKNKTLVKVDGIVFDITDRRKAERELLFKTAILQAQSETILDGILVVDDEGKTVLSNKHFKQMWNIPQPLLDTQDDEKMLDHAVGLLKYPDEFITKVKYLYEHKDEKSRDEIELKDGRFFDRYSSPLIGENGRYFGRIWYFRDITESRRIAEALSESEEKYRTLVESSGEAIATIDANGVYLFMNTTKAKRFGAKPQELIGKTVWDLMPKETADKQFSDVREAIGTGKGINRTELIQLQEQTKWYNRTVEPLKESTGLANSVMVISSDITDLKNAEEELDKYREEMARAEQLASVGIFSAIAAHELTQPLTVIRLLIENALTKLETTTTTETITEKLKDSLTEISNITSVVDKFRGYARKSTKKIFTGVKLEATGHKIANLLSESAQRIGVTIQIKDMKEIPEIYANEADMEQMFFSLIANAVQANNSRKNCQITVSARQQEDYVELQFHDTCGGIKPEHMGKIFEPFFTTKPSGKGTGLGLSIVQDIVTRTRGKIHAESKYGEGTTFFVTLPVKKE